VTAAPPAGGNQDSATAKPATVAHIDRGGIATGGAGTPGWEMGTLFPASVSVAVRAIVLVLAVTATESCARLPRPAAGLTDAQGTPPASAVHPQVGSFSRAVAVTTVVDALGPRPPSAAASTS
jgi:hypothetical protein